MLFFGDWGKYLLDEIESLFPNGSEGTESVKNKENEYFSYYPKYNCIFPVSYLIQNQMVEHDKKKDNLAIKLLSGI